MQRVAHMFVAVCVCTTINQHGAQPIAQMTRAVRVCFTEERPVVVEQTGVVSQRLRHGVVPCLHERSIWHAMACANHASVKRWHSIYTHFPAGTRRTDQTKPAMRGHVRCVLTISLKRNTMHNINTRYSCGARLYKRAMWHETGGPYIPRGSSLDYVYTCGAMEHHKAAPNDTRCLTCAVLMITLRVCTGHLK